MKSPIGLLINFTAWGLAVYYATDEVGDPPMAATFEQRSNDIDQDGLRDRDDPVIDFFKAADKYRGDYGINAKAMDWDSASSLTCLDNVCNVRIFPRLVTLPDGGTFALFHLPDSVSGNFLPWNAGNLSCQEASPSSRHPECWADLKGFAQDSLVGPALISGQRIHTIRIAARGGPDS
mgnify:CR=1 FL=1